MNAVSTMRLGDTRYQDKRKERGTNWKRELASIGTRDIERQERRPV